MSASIELANTIPDHVVITAQARQLGIEPQSHEVLAISGMLRCTTPTTRRDPAHPDIPDDFDTRGIILFAPERHKSSSLTSTQATRELGLYTLFKALQQDQLGTRVTT